MSLYRVTIEISEGRDEQRSYEKWVEVYTQIISTDEPLMTNVVATVNNLIPKGILKLKGVDINERL